MKKMPRSVQIRNPRIIEIIASERSRTDRTGTQAAETLILEAVEARRIKRAVAKASVSNHVSESTTVAA